MKAAGFSEILVMIYQTTWCPTPEESNLHFISHSLKCYAASCVQVWCRGRMGSRMAGILVSVVGDPDTLIPHLASCVPFSHQTSKANQRLLLAGPVLVRLLHSVVAHCHLKSQICTCILAPYGMMTTWILDSPFVIFGKD
jgi:hypothetical protein